MVSYVSTITYTVPYKADKALKVVTSGRFMKQEQLECWQV